MTAFPRRALSAAPSFAVLSLAAVVLLAAPSGALAQAPPDLTGQWELTADVFPVTQPPQDGEDPCSFAGTADITQSGGDFSGSADLGLLGGPAECPVEMDAAVTGTVDEMGMVDGAMLDGQLGTAFFSGQFGALDGQQGGGTVGVEVGPFGGSSGIWSAVLGAPPVQAIPTLTAVGLIALIGLLAASALFIVRRRQTV